MAEDLDNIDGSGFWGHFFFFFVEKSQSYMRINTVTAMDRTRLIPEEKKNKSENAGKKKKKKESGRFLRVGQSTANLLTKV